MLNKIGKNLKKILLDKNIQQKDLSEKLGITRQALNRWCLDKDYPSRKNLSKLSEILEVPESYFFQSESAQSNNMIHEQEAKYNISHYQKQIEDLKTQMLTMQNLINILAEKINKLESAHKN